MAAHEGRNTGDGEDRPLNDGDRLVRLMIEFDAAVEECSSPLHYGVSVSPARFARDKARYLNLLREEADRSARNASASPAGENQCDEERYTEADY